MSIFDKLLGKKEQTEAEKERAARNSKLKALREKIATRKNVLGYWKETAFELPRLRREVEVGEDHPYVLIYHKGSKWDDDYNEYRVPVSREMFLDLIEKSDKYTMEMIEAFNQSIQSAQAILDEMEK